MMWNNVASQVIDFGTWQRYKWVERHISPKRGANLAARNRNDETMQDFIGMGMEARSCSDRSLSA